ncbi:MAG: lytic transglycosylase domain-containing protein [Pseudomonadota bacterium]
MAKFWDLVGAAVAEGLTACAVGSCVLAGAIGLNAAVGDVVKDSWRTFQSWSERSRVVYEAPNRPLGPPSEYRRLAETVALDHAGAPGIGAAGLDGPKFVRLFSALVSVESGFNPHAISSAGAIGLGQLMPETAAELGVADPFEPVSNLNGAARYLTGQLAQFEDVSLALAAYNAGPGRVLEYGGIPPFAETRAFVELVMDRAGI